MGAGSSLVQPAKRNRAVSNQAHFFIVSQLPCIPEINTDGVRRKGDLHLGAVPGKAVGRVKPPGVLILPEDQNIAPGEAGYPQAASSMSSPPYPFPFSAGWA